MSNYTITRQVLFNGMLQIGDLSVYGGNFILKKSAIKNKKQFHDVETAINWVKNDQIYTVKMSEDKEKSLLDTAIFRNNPSYKYTRSKILFADTNKFPPKAMFCCPETGSLKFVNDEFVFNFNLDTLYGSDESTMLLDFPDMDNWSLAVSVQSKPANFDIELETVSMLVLTAYSEAI